MAERRLSGKDLILYLGRENANTVTGATVTAAGSGYTSAPSVNFSGGGGTGANAISTIADGAVTGITILSAGSGYTSAPTITLSGGGGSGATATAQIAASETMDPLACLENNDISQTLNLITTDTKCGRLVDAGTEEASIDFSLVALIDPDGNKVSLVALQEVFKAKEERNWRITTADQAAGDPIFTFSATLTSYNIPTGTNDPLRASGTLTVNEDGITLTEAD